MSFIESLGKLLGKLTNRQKPTTSPSSQPQPLPSESPSPQSETPTVDLLEKFPRLKQVAESKWVAPYLKTPKVQAINKAATKVVDSLSMLSDIYEQTSIEKKLFLKAHQELIEKHPERYSFMGPLEFGKIKPIDQDKFNPELPSLSQGPSLHSKDYNPLIKSGQDKDFEYFFDEQGRQYMKPRHETALQTNKSYDLSKEGVFTIGDQEDWWVQNNNKGLKPSKALKKYWSDLRKHRVNEAFGDQDINQFAEKMGINVTDSSLASFGSMVKSAANKYIAIPYGKWHSRISDGDIEGQDIMVFNRDEEVKKRLKKNSYPAKQGQIVVFAEQDSPLSEADGKKLYQLSEEYLSLIDDPTFGDFERRKIKEVFDKEFGAYKYLDEKNNILPLTAEIFTSKLKEAKEAYAKAKENTPALKDVDRSLVAKLTGEIFDEDVQKRLKVSLTADQIKENFYVQTKQKSAMQELVDSAMAKYNLKTTDDKRKLDIILESHSYSSLIEQAQEFMQNTAAMVGHDADYKAGATILSNAVNFAAALVANKGDYDGTINELGYDPFSLPKEYGDQQLVQYKDAYNFLRDKNQWLRDSTFDSIAQRPTDIVSHVVGLTNDIGKVTNEGFSILENGMGTLYAASVVALNGDKYDYTKDYLNLRNKFMNLDILNAIDNADFDGDGKRNLWAATRFVNNIMPMASDILGVFLGNAGTSSVLSKVHTADKGFLATMRIIRNADKAYDTVKLSKLDKFKLVTKNTLAWLTEETLQNGLFSGLQPGGYTKNDAYIDAAFGTVLGGGLRVLEYVNKAGVFKELAQEAVYAGWYLTGPLGLSPERAARLMDMLQLNELQMFGNNIKNMLKPALGELPLNQADFHEAVLQHAKRNKQVIADLESLATHAAKVSDQNFMSNILQSSDYSLEVKKLIKTVNVINEFGDKISYTKWVKPAGMTEEAFDTYKNELRKELYSKRINKDRYKNITTIRKYFKEEIDQIISSGKLKQIFYQPVKVNPADPNSAVKWIEKKEVTIPGKYLGDPDNVPVKGTFKQMKAKVINAKVKELIKVYGINTLEHVKNKGKFFWKLWDVADDMGELPVIPQLLGLRFFRARINSSAIARDATVRSKISNLGRDATYGRAFKWYIDKLTNGERTVEDLSLEELEHYLDEFAYAAKEKYLKEFKLEGDVGKPSRIAYSNSKEYLINNTYNDAIRMNNKLSTMSVDTFSAIRDSRLEIDQKELIMRARQPTDVRFRDDFINLRESSWHKAFNNVAEQKIQFKNQGEIYFHTSNKAYTPDLARPIKDRYKTKLLKYKFISKDHDDIVHYDLLDGKRPVGRLSVKDGQLLKFTNLQSELMEEAGGMINGEKVRVKDKKYIGFTIKSSDYSNVSPLTDDDFSKIAVSGSFSIADTVNIPDIPNAPRVSLNVMHRIMAKIRNGTLSYSDLRRFVPDLANKVSPGYFSMVMKDKKLSNAGKMQLLNVAMLNETVNETRQAIEIDFSTSTKFFYNGQASEGVIYSKLLPEEGHVVLRDPLDPSTARKLYYVKSETKEGSFFLYNSPDHAKYKFYTGILDISGEKPKFWLAKDHKAFKKGERLAFDGKASFIKDGGDVDQFVKETILNHFDEASFVKVSADATYEDLYKTIYNEKLPDIARYELESDPTMNPHKFMQIIAEDILSRPAAQAFTYRKTADGIALLKEKLDLVDKYRMERLAMDDTQLAKAINYKIKNQGKDFLPDEQEIIRILYPNKEELNEVEELSVYGYKFFGVKPVKEQSKAARLLNERRDRLLLAVYKNPKYLSLPETKKSSLLKNVKMLGATESEITAMIKENPGQFRDMIDTHYDVISKAYNGFTVSPQVRQRAEELKDQLDEMRKGIQPSTNFRPKYQVTEETIALRKKRDELISEAVTKKQKELEDLVEKAEDPNLVKKHQEALQDMQEVEDLAKIVKTYNNQKVQGEYSKEELMGIAKRKLEGVQSTIRKEPLLTETAMSLIERIKKSVGVSVISVDENGKVTQHIASKAAKSNIDNNMHRIVSLMNSKDAPNAAYLEQLNTIVYNPEYALETTIGHEWYHAATTMMMDQERRLKVTQEVWDEYKDMIVKSAEVNGYTPIGFAETHPGMAYDQESYIKWITEEWLAERFGEYVNNKLSPTGKLKKFFEDLWEYIRMYFGNPDVHALFDDIYHNRLEMKAPTYDQVVFPIDPLSVFRQTKSPRVIAEDGKYLISRATTEEWLDQVIKNKGKDSFVSFGITENAGKSIYGDIIITSNKKIQDFKDITISNGNMFSPNRNLLAARYAYEQEKKALSFIPGMYKKTFVDFFSRWSLMSDEMKAPYFEALSTPEAIKGFADEIYGKQIFNTNPIQENPFIMQVDQVDLSRLGDQNVYQDKLLDFLTSKNKIAKEFGSRTHEEFYNSKGILNWEEMVNDYLKRYAGDPDLEDFYKQLEELKEVYENNLPYFEVLQKDFDLADRSVAHVPHALVKKYEKTLKPFGIEVIGYGDDGVFKDIDEGFRTLLQRRTPSDGQIIGNETLRGIDINKFNYNYTEFVSAKLRMNELLKKHNINLPEKAASPVNLGRSNTLAKYENKILNKEYNKVRKEYEELLSEINEVEDARRAYMETPLFKMMERINNAIKQDDEAKRTLKEQVALATKKADDVPLTYSKQELLSEEADNISDPDLYEQQYEYQQKDFEYLYDDDSTKLDYDDTVDDTTFGTKTPESLEVGLSKSESVVSEIEVGAPSKYAKEEALARELIGNLQKEFDLDFKAPISYKNIILQGNIAYVGGVPIPLHKQATALESHNVKNYLANTLNGKKGITSIGDLAFFREKQILINDRIPVYDGKKSLIRGVVDKNGDLVNSKGVRILDAEEMANLNYKKLSLSDEAYSSVKGEEGFKLPSLDTKYGQQDYLLKQEKNFLVKKGKYSYSWGQTSPLIPLKGSPVGNLLGDNYWIDPAIKLDEFRKNIVKADQLSVSKGKGILTNNEEAYIEYMATYLDTPKGRVEVEYNVFAPFDFTKEKFEMVQTSPNVVIWGWNSDVFSKYDDALRKNGYELVYSRLDADEFKHKAPVGYYRRADNVEYKAPAIREPSGIQQRADDALAKADTILNKKVANTDVNAIINEKFTVLDNVSKNLDQMNNSC